MRKSSALFKLLRPKQWVKNYFLYASVLFSYNILKPEPMLRATLAFFAFCMISSATYALNDIIDRKKDMLHPGKATRPLVAGTVTIAEAAAISAILAVAAFVLSVMLDWRFTLIILAYALNNILYTFFIKKTVILDVISISLNFILRVVAGAVVIDVFVSSWILLCTMQLALFLGFAKRRSELMLLNENAEGHRESLKQYNIEFIDHMLSVVTSTAVVSYSLYAFSQSKQIMMVTIAFVLYGIFRYQYLIYVKKRTEGPEELVLTDWPFMINAALWALTSGIILYN